MKAPEDIKKGLRHCSEDGCKRCTYEEDCHISDGGSELAADALEYIRQLEAQMPRWISVKERMPDFFDTVIIIDDRKVTFPAHYGEKSGLKGFYSVDGYFYTYITHWMPLPEPPKEE